MSASVRVRVQYFAAARELAGTREEQLERELDMRAFRDGKPVARLAIDRIKQSVPTWKKEWSPDGSALWVNPESDERN
jgi:molybdopterin converting factor small subunit